jgi:hypothetical protein
MTFTGYAAALLVEISRVSEILFLQQNNAGSRLLSRSLSR